MSQRVLVDSARLRREITEHGLSPQKLSRAIAELGLPPVGKDLIRRLQKGTQREAAELKLTSLEQILDLEPGDLKLRGGPPLSDLFDRGQREQHHRGLADAGLEIAPRSDGDDALSTFEWVEVRSEEADHVRIGNDRFGGWEVGPSDGRSDEPRLGDVLTLYTPHDGHLFPACLERFCRDDATTREVYEEEFVHERDWGAHAVASAVCARLDLSAYLRFKIARCSLDINRFPGVSPNPNLSDDPHLERLSVPHRIATEGRAEEVEGELMEIYDQAAGDAEAVLTQRTRGTSGSDLARSNLIFLAIHTYDAVNPTGTGRPPVSIIYRPSSYQESGVLGRWSFDPMLPQELAEFTADRVLAGRLALELENSYVPTALNYPYALPDGSLDLRSQVWFFWRYLRTRFEAETGDPAGDDEAPRSLAGLLARGIVEAPPAEDPAYGIVWRALENSNGRLLDAWILRGLASQSLHRGEPSLTDERLFQRAKAIYDTIHRYVRSARGIAAIRDWRLSPGRPSSLSIEVRKDYLFEDWTPARRGEPPKVPSAIRPKALETVSDAIARGLLLYFYRDRLEKRKRAPMR